MKKFFRKLSFLLIAAALGGCASQSVAPNRDILAVTRANGKGVPYGRSDNGQVFTPLTRLAADSSYGFEPENPVKVGGVAEGPARERAYLNGLRGPGGEPIEYERAGSCCPFKSPNGFMGEGLLDAFIVTYPGRKETSRIYINMYDKADLLVPLGFTARKSGQ